MSEIETMNAAQVKSAINVYTLGKGLEHRNAPVYVELEDGERRLITSVFGVVEKDGTNTVHLYAGIPFEDRFEEEETT